MKVKILIGVICFVVGAGAYYLYENNFSQSVKLEKCADQEWKDKFYKKLKPENQQKVDKATLKKKLILDTYKTEYLNCLNLAKKIPQLFKDKY